MSAGKKRLNDKKWIWLAAKAAAVIFIILYAFVFVFDFHIYRGDDMYPNLKDGELCLIYRVKNVNRDDIVYYSKGENSGMSRIAATAGDKVSITNGNLYINGTQPNGYENISGNMKKHKIKKGCVFLINDSGGTDSRDFGDVPLKDIEGKIIASMKVRGF